MRSRHLFYDGDLRNALEGHARTMDKEIAEASEEHLMQADEDEWVAALVERYSVEAPQLQTEQWWQDAPAEIKFDVSGYPGLHRQTVDRPRVPSGFGKPGPDAST